jgi:hypothetical protein
MKIYCRLSGVGDEHDEMMTTRSKPCRIYVVQLLEYRKDYSRQLLAIGRSVVADALAIEQTYSCTGS